MSRLTALIAAICLSSQSLAEWHLIEEPVYLFIHNSKRGEHLCSIDVHLWVSGPKRETCLRKLEAAAHMARFEAWATKTR